MASAAAIAGISTYGLKWRWVCSIGLRNNAARLVAMIDHVENPLQAQVLHPMWFDDIVEPVRVYVEKIEAKGVRDDHERALVRALNDWVYEAKTVLVSDIDTVYDGDPNAWIESRIEDLHELYDVFDYYRVCCY
ncbi:hypothetical protein HOU03_gp380 [Caulobacter phage CcrSC]|uniref:Uncharacterized protein n=1 Tax=Caulobacter phage CcrSC TaxID=2283272 RepID=A0A385EG87_9CAUD|nr:hypothetical protein HOU03_gp380 [Caulobacter phage CcrSC]AXQ69888.1 hypothetical protein CcrSC_gp306 [Caulobacter phage CcrSC]